MLTSMPGLVLLIAAAAMQEGEAPGAPPEVREAPSIRAKCACPDEPEEGIILLEGLVVDAELKVAPDGRSTLPRQATIFNISGENDRGVSGRTPVYHSANTDKCGVVFDYGKKYSVAVRENAEGELETDACLMKAMDG